MSPPVLAERVRRLRPCPRRAGPAPDLRRVGGGGDRVHRAGPAERAHRRAAARRREGPQGQRPGLGQVEDRRRARLRSDAAPQRRPPGAVPARRRADDPHRADRRAESVPLQGQGPARPAAQGGLRPRRRDALRRPPAGAGARHAAEDEDPRRGILFDDLFRKGTGDLRRPRGRDDPARRCSGRDAARGLSGGCHLHGQDQPQHGARRLHAGGGARSGRPHRAQAPPAVVRDEGRGPAPPQAA